MNYDEAASVRKHGLMNQITERLLDQQGIGESFGKSISSVTRAKMMGMKEKFDPINIAKFVTGGSNLAGVLVGRLLGRSQEDLNYFVGKDKSGKDKNKDPLFLYSFSQNVQNVKVGDTYANILGRVYTLFKKIDDEEILLSELRKNFQEEELLEKQKRDKELTDALKRMGGKKTTTTKSGKDNVTKPSETEDREPYTPSGLPTPTPRPKPEPTFFDRAKTTASRVASFIGWKGLAVGGAAAIGLGYAGDVKARIAGRESGADYGQMNIPPGETKQQNVFNLEQMTINEVLRFQSKRGKQYAKGGSEGTGKAAGKYQMMPSFIMTHAPKALGPNWKNENFSRDNQEKIMDSALSDYKSRLKRNNIPVNDVTLYMMHFAGVGGGLELSRALMYGSDNDKVGNYLSSVQKTHNPSISSLTVGEYRNKLKRSGFTFEQEDTTSNIGTIGLGNKIDSSSQENVNLIDRAKNAAFNLLNINKNQVTNVTNYSTMVYGEDRSQDDSEFTKKQQSK